MKAQRQPSGLSDISFSSACWTDWRTNSLGPAPRSQPLAEQPRVKTSLHLFYGPSSSLLYLKSLDMTAVAKRRLAALSEQLVSPIPDQGKFEDIPILKKVAPSSVGPRIQGKVVIVTGTSAICSPL